MTASRMGSLKNKKYILDSTLDKSFPPVGRMRLLSDGISAATRVGDKKIHGDRACIGCGNCLDGCPVLLKNIGIAKLSNQRTSMALENIVGSECKSCYSCIQSCPQTDAYIKDYAANYRMGEKISHWWLAISIILLAATGISLNHFRFIWPEELISLISIFHRIFAVAFISTPFIFFMLAPRAARNLIKSAYHWTKEDIQFTIQWLRFRLDPGKYDKPLQTKFNSGEKFWYSFITLVLIIFTVTGIVQWQALEQGGPAPIWVIIHVVFAVSIDILWAIHVYIKFIRRVILRYVNRWKVISNALKG